MKEILITSSVLIAAVLLARWLFRGKVSQKLIYAAWLLVALRLLIPVHFGQSSYSVTSLTQQLEAQSKPVQQFQQAMDEPIVGPSRTELYQQLLDDYIKQHSAEGQPSLVTPEIRQQLNEQVDDTITVPSLSDILIAVWIIGMCGMGAWFVAANAIFLRRARKDSSPIPCDEATVPVRISNNVPTPCLVGFFRPVIYLTPGSTADEQTQSHVLAHELTHLRHWDHIWALVRCLCLCIYWFNPLVWLAAGLSRRDCELACDEGALKRLGDEQRIAYGKTLLTIVTQSMSPVHLLETPTAMNETKKQLKERVCFITTGCAFLGSKPTKPNMPPVSIADPTISTNLTEPSTSTVPNEPLDPIEPEEKLTYEEQILQTTALAKQYFGISRLQFLYTANQIITDYLMSGSLDSSTKQAAQQSILWDAGAIADRALYLDGEKLMLRFQYVLLADKNDPLYGTFRIPIDRAYQLPDDLEAQSYLWLLKMADHVDGFTADKYSILLLETAFADPDLFLQYMAEFDIGEIAQRRNMMYYAIASQEEADLFSGLLAALSRRTDLNQREQKALQILAEVPEEFPFEITVTPTPNATGKGPNAVSGSDPQLPGGLVTTPPQNTVHHTHSYTLSTIKPTCTVKGYDYHLCQCGAYYCDNFKSAVGHQYEVSYVAEMKRATYDEEGYVTMECWPCGDRYFSPLTAGKDYDFDAIIAECSAYAESLGFTVIPATDWDRTAVDTRTASYYDWMLYTSRKDGPVVLTESTKQMIDYLNKSVYNKESPCVLCIEVWYSVSYMDGETYKILIQLDRA